MMPDSNGLTEAEQDVLVEALNRTHWNGRGCGTHGNGGCVYCFGPSPMGAHEVVEELAPTVARIVADTVDRESRLRARIESVLQESKSDLRDGTDGLSPESASWRRGARHVRVAVTRALIDVDADDQGGNQ